MEVSDCSVLIMPIPALHFAFKNNKKLKPNNKQMSKSSLSSIVAGVCVCMQVCAQAAEKSENLFTGKKLFQKVFFPSSSPISRCWGNRHPRRSKRLTHPARSFAARITPRATAQEQKKYRLQQFNMKYIKSPFPVSAGQGW